MPEPGATVSAGPAPTSPAPERTTGSSAAFLRKIEGAAAAYKANGYSHPDPRGRLKVRRMADVLAGTPPVIRWLVPEYIPLRTVTLLTGDGGVGKSLLAQQLMTACAAGVPFLGMEPMKCRVFGLFCEDETAVLHHRQLKLCESMAIADDALADFAFMERAGEDAVLYGPTVEDPREMDFTDFFYRFMKELREFRPQLVVVDTAADTFAGNENARPQVRAFIRRLRSVATDLDAAVILCAHPSVAGIASGSGFSGSTAWHNSVRSRLYLTRPDDGVGADPDARTLRAMKANYGPIAGEVPIRFDRGAFVREARDSGMVASIARNMKAKAVIELVRDAAAKGQHLSHVAQSAGRYLPTVASRRLGLAASTAKKIMEDLLIEDVIRAVQTDPHSKQRGLVVT